MELSIREWLSKHSRNCSSLKMTQPVQVACWTKESKLDGGRYLYGDSSGFMPLHEVHLPADLNQGYPQDYVRQDEEATPVDPIVHAAQSVQVDWGQIDICTFRNNLNKVALTPLNPDQAWVVDACFTHGTMFLNIHETPDSFPSYEGADRFMYYGYKFEALCTQGAVVDASSEFGALLSYNLGALRILMGAEIDCHDGAYGQERDGSPSCFLELKTYRRPETQRQHSNMKRFKYPRWWVQSYLAGVKYLVLGGRDDAGTLLEVHKKAVANLPAEARAAGATWDPWVLLGCLHHTLSWMLECTRQAKGQHCTFSYDPLRQNVVLSQQSSNWPEHLDSLLIHEHRDSSPSSSAS